MTKSYLRVLLLALYLLCFVTACGPNAETADQANPATSANAENIQDTKGEHDAGTADSVKEDKNPNGLPERDPNADYIQNYQISALRTSPSIDYTDSKYSWVKLYEEKNEGKIDTDSWAAIDETGKIYGFVPLESEHDDVECFNDFLCVEESKLYKYDGSEVTSQYLNNGETLLRITSCKDDFAIWKCQEDKKYQEDTVYTLRVCNTKGDLLFEIDSKEYNGTNILCTNCRYGGSVFAKLSNDLYISYGNIIDLSSGNMYDIEQYETVQKVKQYAATRYRYNVLDHITAIDDVLFVAVPEELDKDGFIKSFKFYAYKAGEIEPLYSIGGSGAYPIIPVEGRFLLYPNNNAWMLYDIYTGKQVYTSQDSLYSSTFDEIKYSAKHNFYIEQVGDFVGVFSDDGTPCFEPIEGKLVANWLDYNGSLLIEYTGHAYDGAGLYVVDMEGNMTMLSITGSKFVLNAQNRIMVVDSNGTYKLYDKDWNQLF